MPKFVFNLDGVLRQRTHVEREKQRELAQKQVVLVAIQEQLRKLEESVRASNEDFRTHRLTGRLDMDFITAHRRFLSGMQRQGMALAQKIALAQRAVDEARAVLAEAAKQRKIIEKLRDRQFERWRQGQAKRESAEMDEIGMQLAYRNLVDSSESSE